MGSRSTPPLKSRFPDVSLIGAPTDIGAGHRGSSMGPEALRVAGIDLALAKFGVHVVDRGNVCGPLNPWKAPEGGYRHLAEVVAWNTAVYEAFSKELADGRLPVLLGGDHCLAIGTISAVAAHCRRTGQKLRVLWLDAHADFNTCATTPSGNIHGMPVSTLCGLGAPELVSLSGACPAIDPADVRQIGIRSVDEGEKRLVHSKGVEVYDMRYIGERGMRDTMQHALQGIDDNTHIHVSFDVDFLDPSISPGVGTQVPGGPDYREAQLVMEMIADTGRMRSLDIVELNPAWDERNRTAKVAVDLVESLFGKSTLLRKGETVFGASKRFSRASHGDLASMHGSASGEGMHASCSRW